MKPPTDREEFPLATGAVVLASASVTRIAMLRHAGVACHAVPAAVDEEEIKAAMKAEGAGAGEIAEALAVMKARAVARRFPGSLTIGADQILECDGQLYDKPPDRAAARAQLQALRGRMHELTSAVCVFQGPERQWHNVARARLWLRDFSDDFLDAYLDQCGDDVLSSVGAYRLEGPGVQLFARIEGDWFTILGLPLLPLLDYLRTRRMLRA